jgi:hypothetical protein
MSELLTSYDALVFIGFAAAFFLHTLFVDKARLLVDVFAVYASFLIMVVAPRLFPQVNGWLDYTPFVRVLAFALLATLFHILLTHSNIHAFSARIAPFSLITSLGYRLTVVGLFFATGLTFAPSFFRDALGDTTVGLFGNTVALYAWACLPLLFAFAYRKHADNGWIE